MSILLWIVCFIGIAIGIAVLIGNLKQPASVYFSALYVNITLPVFCAIYLLITSNWGFAIGISFSILLPIFLSSTEDESLEHIYCVLFAIFGTVINIFSAVKSINLVSDTEQGIIENLISKEFFFSFLIYLILSFLVTIVIQKTIKYLYYN